jgi:hypothetical protein
MRFSWWGSFVQFQPRSEGSALKELGLINVREMDEEELEVEPTEQLRAMFVGNPSMEDVYPLLVEVVMIFRYSNLPSFVDVRVVESKLRALGITEDGLTGLYDLLSGAA